jgi:hypothetical protein
MIDKDYLRNPEPNLLEEVLWDLIWPLVILGIKRRLTSRDISISWVDEVCTLEDLPEQVKDEEDWNANVGSEEIYYKSALRRGTG